MDKEEFYVGISLLIKVVCIILIFSFAVELVNLIGADRKAFMTDCVKEHTPTECHLAWRTGKFQK